MENSLKIILILNLTFRIKFLEEIEKSLYFIEKLRGKDFKDEIYRTINNEYVLYEDQYTFEKFLIIKILKKYSNSLQMVCKI